MANLKTKVTFIGWFTLLGSILYIAAFSFYLKNIKQAKLYIYLSEEIYLAEIERAWIRIDFFFKVCLVFEILGLLSSILLIKGARQNKEKLLLPWAIIYVPATLNIVIFLCLTPTQTRIITNLTFICCMRISFLVCVQRFYSEICKNKKNPNPIMYQMSQPQVGVPYQPQMGIPSQPQTAILYHPQTGLSVQPQTGIMYQPQPQYLPQYPALDTGKSPGY